MLILILSILTISLIISAFTLIPIANSQPLMEKLNLNENIEYKIKKELLESETPGISNDKSWWMNLIELLNSDEVTIFKEYPILLLIILILASPILIPALFVAYLIFVFEIIIDLIKNIPEYESIWEIIRVLIYIIISPFGFPLFLYYIFILWIFFLLQSQSELFNISLTKFPLLKPWLS